MKTNKTAYAVGLFMLLGLIMSVAAIIWLGVSNYFEQGRNYVAYFDESVQGLDRDSPVKYRGVSIGRVKSVGVAPDGTLIEVMLTIEADMKIESDMVAQLKSVGITGIMFIEMDRKKPGEPEYLPPISFYTEYPIILTKPSGIKMLMDGMDEVLGLINKLDTGGISERLKHSVDRINQIFEDVQVKGLSSDIRTSLARINEILENEKWDRMIDSFAKTGESLNTLIRNTNQTVSHIDKNLNAVLVNADRAITGINTAVADIDRLVADNENDIQAAVSQLKRSAEHTEAMTKDGAELIKNTVSGISDITRRLAVTLQALEKASENLKDFSDTISDQPSQLIFGEPIPPRKVED